VDGVAGTGPGPGRLEERFAEKRPPLSDTEAVREAARCLYCYDAPCIRGCPTHIDIPTFIRKIATGNPRGAARTILTSNLLGASCAKVCPVEVLCEGQCVYVSDGRTPIAIGRLQRWAMESGGGPELLERKPKTGHSVGLVGGGPASLACAGELALKGHAPVIYERSEMPGGLNLSGIAPYKLKVDEALEEAEAILALGVKLRPGTEVGGNVTVDELFARHEALFLGPGLGSDSRLGVPGERGPGVEGAVAWIERMKLDPAASVAGIRRAIVVGGGNTAIDAARELRGLGVESVTVAYRRTVEEMPAYEHEVGPARREGVVVLERTAVAAFERTEEGGPLARVRLVEAENGRPTDRELVTLPADLVLLAIGQSTLADLVRLFPDVKCDRQGRIVVDPETFVTGNPRVFAGGDAVNGGKEVVNAVHDGQVAARAIDRLLREGALAPPVPVPPKSVGGPDSRPKPPGASHA
jgi:glutamate synthase (NADPH/NADH) small chain